MSRISGAVYTVNLQLGSSYGERKRKKKNPQEGGGESRNHISKISH